MPTPTQRIPRHDEYYIHGGDVVFHLDNTLFRVHRFFFIRDSSWFRNKLPYPLPPGETTKGTSDNLPLPLEDVTRAEFARFLWVFYNPKYSLYNASIEEWSSILRLAHKWNFTEVKELAVRGIENIPAVSAVRKIALYQAYNVDQSHLQSAYTALTVRDEAITIDEGRQIGLETALRIADAREVARTPVSSGKKVGNPRPPVTIAGVELQALIKNVFQLSSPGAASEHTARMPTDSGTSTDQSQSTQTNSGSSALDPPQGTGPHFNGSAMKGPPNGHINGTARGGQTNRQI